MKKNGPNELKIKKNGFFNFFFILNPGQVGVEVRVSGLNFQAIHNFEIAPWLLNQMSAWSEFVKAGFKMGRLKTCD